MEWTEAWGYKWAKGGIRNRDCNKYQLKGKNA